MGAIAATAAPSAFHVGAADSQLTYTWDIRAGALVLPGGSAVVLERVALTGPVMAWKGESLVPRVSLFEDVGTGALNVSALPVGAYYFVVLDALLLVAARVPFDVVASIELSLGPVSNVTGFDRGEVYAPGGPFSARYTSAGAALPLTLELRSFFNSSTSNTTELNNTVAFAIWTLEGAEGVLEDKLPETMPNGYYGAFGGHGTP